MRRLFAWYRAAYSGLPRQTWLLALVALVNRAGTMVVPFLTLWLTKELGAPAEQAGLLVGCFGAGAMIGSWLGGRLTDAIGAGRVCTASLVLSAIGFLVLGELRDPAHIALCMLGVGTLAEAFRPANVALLAATCPPARRTQGFALLRLAINLGMAIGPVLGGLLAMVDYAWLFRIDAATCLAAAWLFHTSSLGRAALPTADTATAGDGSPWRDPIMLAAMGFGLLVAMAFVQLLSTFPLYLREAYHFDEGTIGLVFAINPILIVLFEMPLVHRLRAVAPLRLVALGSGVVAAGFALLPLGSGFAFALAVTVVWTVGEMLESPQMAGFVSSRSSERNRGRYMGLYTFTFATAFVLAPIVSTWVYGTLGPTALWVGSAAAVTVAALGFAGLARAVERGRVQATSAEQAVSRE